MTPKQTLDALRTFVNEEQQANIAKLHEIWQKPLTKKLRTGETQHITSLKIEDSRHLLATISDDEGRFREGDMIRLHFGKAATESFIYQATIEAQNDDHWLIAAKYDAEIIKQIKEPCYADEDNMDLTAFFHQTLDDIANSSCGRNIILPLIAGELNASSICEPSYYEAADIAEANGLNEKQVDAVAKGVAARHLACIQGPPGTGKTKVISLIAKLLVANGERILLTSHTHMAINNALNKIAKEAVPTIKVGHSKSTKGLDTSIPRFDHADDWQERPDNGYVIGATPFATCSERLKNYQFDTVIFDESSQITVPLALMAMRKAKRFIFVGDHKQLPPVVLSKSVLEKDSYSVFAKLILNKKNVSTMLDQTYRMNSALSRWPSQQFYQKQLTSTGPNENRQLDITVNGTKYDAVFANNTPFIYIKSPGINARTQNDQEAELVTELITTAIQAGIAPVDIGVVTPYRNQVKTIKNKLAKTQGLFSSKSVVIETVERMQGQEREMIILSMCSTDEQFIQSMAEFLLQPQRLNVAITRPMTKLIIIGPELSHSINLYQQDKIRTAYIDTYLSLLQHADHILIKDE